MTTVWYDHADAGTVQMDELRQVAVGMLQARRAMRGRLPDALIHDVGLELLLMVYLAHPSSASASWLSGETNVPERSARRWLTALEDEELVRITEEEVVLTDSGSTTMGDMLTAVVRSQRDLLGWAHH